MVGGSMTCLGCGRGTALQEIAAYGKCKDCWSMSYTNESSGDGYLPLIGFVTLLLIILLIIATWLSNQHVDTQNQIDELKARVEVLESTKPITRPVEPE